jgi:hypothetical protein
MLNLDRGGKLGTAPEPASCIIFALIAGSGLFAGVRKKMRNR